MLAAALMLSSCCETVETTTVDASKDYVYLKTKDGQYSVRVFRYEYDGHKYIMFGQNEYRNGVVHDPDCPCHTTVQEAHKTETSDYPDWW